MSNKLSLLVNFVGVDKLSGSLRSIRMLGRKGTRSLNELRGEGRKLEAQLRDVRREFDGASGNVTALIDRERALERAIESTNRELAERKRLNVIEGQRRAQVARGDAMMGRGREQMAQGATLLAPFVFAAKAGMDYEKQLALLAQKTDLTKQQTDTLGRSILNSARATKQMPKSMIGAADFLSSKGGVSQRQLQAMLPILGRFATAWDADVNDAAKAAHANLLSLGVQVKETSRALDIMGMAGKEGGFEVRDMAQHFPMLTAGLATLDAKGLPAVASLSSALQILEAKTGDGATAANDLANMMRFTQTAQGQKNFKKFGINIVAELKRAARDGADPLERLIDLTTKATGGDNSKIAQLFTDTQAGRAATNLSAEIERYREIRDKAFAAQGITAQEYARMSKTAAANWDEMKGSLSVLTMTLGSELIPSITVGINKIATLANRIASWADANPEAASTIMHIVGGLALFRLGLGATNFLFGGFLKSSADFIAFFRKVDGVSRFGTMMIRFKSIATSTASGAVRAFGIMRAGAMFLAKGLLRAGLMMMANPIVLAITLLVVALAGAAYLVWRHWDTIKAAFFTAWGNIKNFFGKAPDWLKSIGTAMMRGLLMAINPMALAAKLISVAKNGITAFKKYLGIKSPSRVFMALGEHTGEGLAIGMDRKGPRVARAAGKLATGAAAAGALALSPTPIAARSPGTCAQPLTINATFNLTQKNGETDDEFAERIMRKLEELMKKGRRSDYEDHD